ncbi:MAG: LysR family transcriptional regulator [Paraburkholderia tropica]|uniref:LysR family transcriptional regulator n=1 Tax=Paraburkholderia tropica TaxID=92647 RepID=A0ABX5MHS4_9BURK|nr:LysR family transcriptional regulator [Paraburkholderia tropica]MDE1144260.1 LysR family transcriptional regulator [Paraburkholderia tropica]PXX10866.1 LysR family transcriptional regulator [Paraburkholderia tropica]PZW75834.1 LysR family transcriptional regulator [Paraburkholderia tropica]
MENTPLHYSLRQLRYFVATAEALSFTAAAKRLHVSQPSISSALSELENAFGLQLFIRHHAHGLSLTQAGRDLLGRARDLLKSAEELQIAARHSDTGIAGTISLGCLTSVAPPLMPWLMSRFLNARTGVEFQTREGDQETLFVGLRDGTLDVALTYDIDIDDTIDFTPIVEFPPYVLLPAKHRLAASEQVSLKDLLDEPYVMLDLAHSKEYFASLFDRYGNRPVAAFSSSQPEVVRGMVANGLGYSIHNFPLRNSQTVDGGRFVARAIKEKVKPAVLGVARSTRSHPRQLIRDFTAFCYDEVSRAWTK